jgi:hypothetical protein
MKTINYIAHSRTECISVFMIMGFLILCSLPSAMYGQVEVYGYFEPEYAGLYLDTTYYQSSYGKLRIDLASTEIKNVRFGADVVYINYFGKTSWNLLEFLPEDIVSTIPPQQQPYYQFSLRDTFYLDNAFVRLSTNRLAITLGKQQISFGTGYFSNPTDVFNTKDAFDPTYEQPGHNGMRLEIYPVPRVSITALYSPIADEWENSGKLGRIKVGLGHFDISAIGYRYQYTSTDFYTFQQTIEEHTVIGGDVVGELFGLGIWGEGIYTIMENNDDHTYEFLAGSDYTFEGGFYAMLEYHHNSRAKSDHQEYDLNDWMRYLIGESKTLAQDQLYGLIQYPLTDYITLGGMGLYSISDQSAALIPMVNYSMFENVDIAIMFNFYTGEEGTAFSKKLGAGGLARAVVYF